MKRRMSLFFQMIQNLSKWILRLFREEEKLSYPEEFGIIVLNDISLSNGINDSPNKLILRYKVNPLTGLLSLYRTYGYSDSLLHSFRHILKIPFYDQTKEEKKFNIYGEINLNEVMYNKG